MSTWVIGLASGSVEKLLAASMLTGGAVALANLGKLREDGSVHIHVCGTAGRIWGASKLDDFVDICDDIAGVASYLMHCEEAEVVQVL